MTGVSVRKGAAPAPSGAGFSNFRGRKITSLRLTAALGALLAVLAAPVAAAAPGEAETAAWPRGTAVVEYATPAALERALRLAPAQVVRRVPALGVAEVRPAGRVARFAAVVSRLPGIRSVHRTVERLEAAEPALAPAAGAPLQWQYAATKLDGVPADVLRAAASIMIAVIDTGADVTAPDLAAKAPATWSVRTRAPLVDDANGHGTFVASLAAGSVTNSEGIAGAGGDAQLLVVQAGGADGSFTDVQEAAAIVYAVDRGAKILNLSLGGPDSSPTERRAIDYAVGKGALLVAAIGNSHDDGNPVQYPAALLQPVGSNGVGGSGLSVGASTPAGTRASFSSTGSHLSLLAPGVAVLGAVASTSPPDRYPRVTLPGSAAGLYGYGSGTSFATPQVAGAAALVWAANPALAAQDVAAIIEESASGAGRWTPDTGFGVLDVAAAVARARGGLAPFRVSGRRAGRRVDLTWTRAEAASYRVAMSQNGGAEQVLTPATTSTSASYSLVSGSEYSFTVTALDQAGAALAVSAPWSVSLVRTAATLRLTASVRRGKAPLRVRLRARLLSFSASALAGRTIVLESFDGGRWSAAARAATSATGEVAWRYTLARGAYRVRVRFAGDDENLPATSRPVRLTAR